MEFYEFLTANGVEIPTEPANPNFLQRKLYERKLKKFEETWAPVQCYYEGTFTEQFLFLSRLWADYEKVLQKNWGVGLPTLPEEPVELDFSTPDEAYVAMKAFVDTTKWFNKNNEIHTNARDGWISELITAAPEGCKLIVLRTGYKPHAENLATFEEHVENGKPCSITDCFVGMWVAFPPENPNAALETKFWGCTKGNSTVEYVI